jgi:hypothetical protein
MVNSYIIFHLNLAFSSIEEDKRPTVIKNCYWPLLQLVEKTDICIGIEITGWTLEQIQKIDRKWVLKFKELLQSEKCELIGSGWSQIIGPLVPYAVNLWNQKLALDYYIQSATIRKEDPECGLENESTKESIQNVLRLSIEMERMDELPEWMKEIF